MLIISSLSISLSFRILSKKIDDRIPRYRPNYLLILIISTNTVGDLFFIIIVSSLFLNTKKGSIGYLLLLPFLVVLFNCFITKLGFVSLEIIFEFQLNPMASK